jgi:hypothetical protein
MRTWTNEGPLDRTIRIIVGLILLYFGIGGQQIGNWIADIVGLVLLLTGVSGFCLIYRVLRVDTAHRRHAPAP